MAKAPPVEIADGNDAATGTTTDAAWSGTGAGTVISILKKIAGGGGGGGGPVTIADGADVAQGATTDASTASTVVGLLKAIKAAVQGTLATSRTWTLASGTDSVNVGNFPATQPVSGTVTADTELPPASALADTDGNPTTSRVGANGLLWNGTSWDRAPGDKTNGLKVQSAQLPAALDGSGFLKVHEQGVAHVDDNAGSLTVDAPVATPVFVRLSDGAAALIGQKAMAASLPVAVASDQGAVPTTKVPTGGTNVLKTGSLTTSAVTVDQVVLTYTVTAGKTLYLQYLIMYGRLTTLSATASILGAISLETPSGTKIITLDDVNPTTSELEFNPIIFSEPIPVAAGVVVRVVVTPAAVTSMLWRANFGGYEK